MTKTIGQIIKSLRKERNLTQEELAELLNVTAQAISKWENEAGMPDISQIIPLASVFNVSTDVIFGLCSISNNEEAEKIIFSAKEKIVEQKATDIKNGYDIIQDGLKKFPSNLLLLQKSLEYSCALAYPENDCYDIKNSHDIYTEAIRQANIVIAYSNNVTNILRAHMIMVLLHSSYGNTHKALEHAQQFPWRSDMTIHTMYSHINHVNKEYDAEKINCQNGFMFNMDATLDNIIQLGISYENLCEYDDALKMYKSVFQMIEHIFCEDTYLPPKHIRERGDVHILIARTYLKMNNMDEAIIWLTKMVDYDINVRCNFENEMKVINPFLKDVNYKFYWKHYNIKTTLLDKLNSNEFMSLKGNINYIELIQKAKSLDDDY